jgi:hypothetical protein
MVKPPVVTIYSRNMQLIICDKPSFVVRVCVVVVLCLFVFFTSMHGISNYIAETMFTGYIA